MEKALQDVDSNITAIQDAAPKHHKDEKFESHEDQMMHVTSGALLKLPRKIPFPPGTVEPYISDVKERWELVKEYRRVQEQHLGYCPAQAKRTQDQARLPPKRSHDASEVGSDDGKDALPTKIRKTANGKENLATATSEQDSVEALSPTERTQSAEHISQYQTPAEMFCNEET
ncbi:MAG: hypothetical protein SEPTF4163_006363 [Sporothrix epigloea]